LASACSLASASGMLRSTVGRHAPTICPRTALCCSNTRTESYTMKPTGIALLASAIVNLVSVGFVAGGFASQDEAKSTDDVLRTQKLEIVNSKGEVCAILAGHDGLGGSLSLLRPEMRKEDGRPPVFAYLGTPFESFSTFYITDAVDGGCGASIQIEGNKYKGRVSELSFSGKSEHGSFEIHAGRATAGEPSIRIRNGGHGVVLEK